MHNLGMHHLLLLQKIMASCQKINQLRCVFGATISGTSLMLYGSKQEDTVPGHFLCNGEQPGSVPIVTSLLPCNARPACISSYKNNSKYRLEVCMCLICFPWRTTGLSQDQFGSGWTHNFKDNFKVITFQEQRPLKLYFITKPFFPTQSL